jgi:hypothetical protein
MATEHGFRPPLDRSPETVVVTSPILSTGSATQPTEAFASASARSITDPTTLADPAALNSACGELNLRPPSYVAS